MDNRELSATGAQVTIVPIAYVTEQGCCESWCTSWGRPQSDTCWRQGLLQDIVAQKRWGEIWLWREIELYCRSRLLLGALAILGR